MCIKCLPVNTGRICSVISNILEFAVAKFAYGTYPSSLRWILYVIRYFSHFLLVYMSLCDSMGKDGPPDVGPTIQHGS